MIKIINLLNMPTTTSAICDVVYQWDHNVAAHVTGLSELEGHLLVPYSTKANGFYGLHGSFFPIFFLPNSHCHTQLHLLLLNMVQGDALLILIDL